MATTPTPKKTPAKSAAGAKTVRRPSTKAAATKAAAKKAAATKPAAKKAAKPIARPAVPNSAPVEAKIKHKLVRDSFTIPKTEYVVLETLKVRATDLKRPTKKSELIRAGIAALKTMNDKEFLAAVNGVQSLKTGRPKLAEAKKA
jgi:hypothetical protein